MTYRNKERRFENVDQTHAVTYKKLHRTGKLLRGLKSSVLQGNPVLKNTTPYASDHELGVGSGGGTGIAKGRFVQSSVKQVDMGKTNAQRRSMEPSKRIIYAPLNLIKAKMEEFGW